MKYYFKKHTKKTVQNLYEIYNFSVNPVNNKMQRTRSGATDIIAYSESAIRNNTSVVEYCRTSMAAIAGSAAGMFSDIF